MNFLEDFLNFMFAGEFAEPVLCEVEDAGPGAGQTERTVLIQTVTLG